MDPDVFRRGRRDGFGEREMVDRVRGLSDEMRDLNRKRGDRICSEWH